MMNPSDQFHKEKHPFSKKERKNEDFLLVLQSIWGQLHVLHQLLGKILQTIEFLCLLLLGLCFIYCL